MTIKVKQLKTMRYAVVESNGAEYSVSEDGGVYHGTSCYGDGVHTEELSDAEWYAIRDAGMQAIREQGE